MNERTNDAQVQRGPYAERPTKSVQMLSTPLTEADMLPCTGGKPPLPGSR